MYTRRHRHCRVDIPDEYVTTDDVPTLCPFGRAQDGPCLNGCMGCDEGVRCCEIGDTCLVTSQCMTPCPHNTYMEACMWVTNELGEAALTTCDPDSDITAQVINQCTAYRGQHDRTQLTLAAQAAGNQRTRQQQAQLQQLQYPLLGAPESYNFWT